MLDKLNDIINNNFHVHLKVNGHRESYESISVYIENLKLLDDSFDEDYPKNIIDEIIKRSIIIELWVYPTNNISFLKYIHYDLIELLKDL